MQYLNYNRPYIAFGCVVLRERCKFNGLSDLRFRTHNFHPDGSRIETKVADRAPASTVNYINGIYQYVEGDFVLQFDGERTRAVYNYIADPLLQHNIVGKVPAQLSMERRLKAIIQQYMLRMTTDRLTVD